MTDPNILCLSIDSLRADFTSFVNEEESTTPFLESFAEDATVFTRAITPSIWTLPVHTSVFTGLYPLEHGVMNSQVELGDHPTFAELLGGEGYSTAAFHKSAWFETGDITRGFGARNVSHEVSGEENSNVLGRQPFIRNALERISPTLREIGTAVSNHIDVTYYGYGNDIHTVDATVKWLKETPQPFCTFVHFKDAHWPYAAPKAHVKQFSDCNDAELLWNRVRWQRPLYENRDRTWAGDLRPPAHQVEILKDVYRGCVYWSDRLAESLLSALEDDGVLDNTIVVVFGDHGDLFGDDGIFGHQYSMADPLINVPLLIRDPTGSLPKGRVADPVQLNDIYPTILDLCGVDPPSTNSVDLAAGETRSHAYVHYESRESSDTYSPEEFPPARQFCVWASPTEKLVWYPDSDEYDGPAGDDDDLRHVLETHLESLVEVPPKRGVDVDESVIRNLKNMGYM